MNVGLHSLDTNQFEPLSSGISDKVPSLDCDKLVELMLEKAGWNPVKSWTYFDGNRKYCKER